MACIDFITSTHQSTKRNYLARVIEFPKAQAAVIARKFGEEYWDGSRQCGYGGYHYDGRWRKVARDLIAHYKLVPGQRILDVGCGKGFLLYDLMKELPGLQVYGIDISEYAIRHCKEEVRPFLEIGSAIHLPFKSNSIDLVISINTLHNLYCYDLDLALREIERVSIKNKYIVVESYRNEEEKANLLHWQFTCEAFCTPKEWEW